jgi:hypothetical protein
MGVVWTSLIGICLGIGAYGAARFGFRQPRGLPRALATILLAWVWLTFGMEVLGGAGVLSRPALMAWAVLAVVIGAACRARGARAEEVVTTPEPWSWDEILTGGIMVWASAVLGAGSLLRALKVVSDGPIYHLYFAARWWRSGRLDAIAVPFGESAATYFPAVGDLWFTALMVAGDGDALAKVGQVPFALVGGLALVAIARRLGAGRSAAVIAAAWVFTSSPMFLFAFAPNVDSIFAAGYLLSAYFFLRHDLGDDGLPALALGALAGGCALGTKAPGVVFVPPLLAWGIVSALRKRAGWSGKLRGMGIVLGLPWVVAGFWFVRNAWWTGNPLYPLHLEAFGRVWLLGWYGPDVMQYSKYYLPVTDWRSFADILAGVLDPRLLPVWLASLAGVWSLSPRSAVDRKLDRYVWLASAGAIANVALYWFLVPYRTQQRFMIHALGLAGIPLARTLDRSVLLRWLGVALLAVHVFSAQSWPFGTIEPPWDLSPLVPNAVAGLLRLPTPADLKGSGLSALLIVGATFGIGLVSFASVWAWSLVAKTRGRTGWVRAIVATLLLAVVAGAPNYPWGAEARRAFFPDFPDFYRGWLALDRASGTTGTRVAYAGTDIPYYLMGAGLRNEVRYVNIDAHPGWLMHDYHREALATGSGPAAWPYPRPGWDRSHPDYAAWLANLHAEGIRLLVVTRADPANGPHNVADSEGFPIERQWADSHPESFEPLYGPREHDPRFRLYHVRAGPDGS